MKFGTFWIKRTSCPGVLIKSHRFVVKTTVGSGLLEHLAPFVQKLDSAIHRKNHYQISIGRMIHG